VIGLLSDDQGEPMAVRVFAGNTVDPTTLPEQIKILKQQFRVEQVVLVDQTPYATTLPDALAALSRLCLIHYPIDEQRTVTHLPKPDQHQAAILKALRVRLSAAPM